MKIAIMGSGAVGAYVGARLQAAGADVTFIARGAHLQAMQTKGLSIQMPDKDLLLPQVKATSDPATIGTADLVVFAVKLTDTFSAAQSMRPLVSEHTRVFRHQRAHGLRRREGVSQLDRKHHQVGSTYGGGVRGGLDLRQQQVLVRHLNAQALGLHGLQMRAACDECDVCTGRL